MTDAAVIGSGHNGLAAAIVLARAGLSVQVLEASETVGGAARSAELTLPGFVHDVCSSVYPMAVWSPFFRQLPLKEYGLEWVQPAARWLTLSMTGRQSYSNGRWNERRRIWAKMPIDTCG